MARDDDDETTNHSSNARIEDVLAARGLSRRGVLAGGLGMGALGLFSSGISALLTACGDNNTAKRQIAG